MMLLELKKHKEEVEEVVEFLKDPRKFSRLEVKYQEDVY